MRRGSARVAVAAACASISAALLAACASGPSVPSGAAAPLSVCADDSSNCIQGRQRALTALLADRERSWVTRRPTPTVYASGVRLFAYMKLRKSLSCRELAMARAEAKGARRALRTSRDRLTTAQIARGALLGDEVAKAMAREMRRRRCART